jgi:hypothetical protein
MADMSRLRAERTEEVEALKNSLIAEKVEIAKATHDGERAAADEFESAFKAIESLQEELKRLKDGAMRSRKPGASRLAVNRRSKSCDDNQSASDDARSAVTAGRLEPRKLREENSRDSRRLRPRRYVQFGVLLDPFCFGICSRQAKER